MTICDRIGFWAKAPDRTLFVPSAKADGNDLSDYIIQAGKVE